VTGLCGTSPGVHYSGGRWTLDKDPPTGHEHRPCKSCLQRLGGHQDWFWIEGITRITKKELHRLWGLRRD
jgi:hypothetical protein